MPTSIHQEIYPIPLVVPRGMTIAKLAEDYEITPREMVEILKDKKTFQGVLGKTEKGDYFLYEGSTINEAALRKKLITMPSFLQGFRAWAELSDGSIYVYRVRQPLADKDRARIGNTLSIPVKDFRVSHKILSYDVKVVDGWRSKLSATDCNPRLYYVIGFPYGSDKFTVSSEDLDQLASGRRVLNLSTGEVE